MKKKSSTSFWSMNFSEDEVSEIRKLFENECNRRKAAEAEVEHLKILLGKNTHTQVYFS